MILTEAELRAWGSAVGAQVDGPLLVLLSGPLGAGKSTLAREIARGAGVTSNMPSPTFNILLRYAGGDTKGVTHVDLYRLEGPADLDELGWEELFAEDLVIVEWPDRAGDRLPADRWEIGIEFVEGQPQVRDVTCRPRGNPAPIPLPDAPATAPVSR